MKSLVHKVTWKVFRSLNTGGGYRKTRCFMRLEEVNGVAARWEHVTCPHCLKSQRKGRIG